MDPMGQASFEFGFDPSKGGPALAEELLDAIAKHVQNIKKRGVVVLDEFQQIGELEDDRLEKVLRSKIQSQHHLSYVFAGSKRHLLMEMFSNPSRPFYKSAVHFPLKAMPRDEMKTFVIERFQTGGLKIAEAVAQEILGIAEDHPYHTQQLCFHIWESARKGGAVDKPLIASAIDRILSSENASYHNTWGLLGRVRRLALIALANLGEGDAPFSSAFLRRVGLPSADGFRKALESLVTKELVEKENGSYRISDVFLKRWLLRL